MNDLRSEMTGYQSESENLVPGDVLRRARESRGLSQHQVAESLRLSPGLIAALETGDDARIPGKVFIDGYMRAYAKLVGVAPDLVAPDDTSTTHAQAPFLPTPIQLSGNKNKKGYRRSSNSSWILLGVVVLAVIVFVANRVWSTMNTSVIEEPGLDIESALPPESNRASVLDSVVEPGTAEQAMPPVDDEANSAGEDPVMLQTEQAPISASSLSDNIPSGQSVSDTAPPAQEQKVVPTGPLSSLVLRYRADSWTEVNDARGQRLMQRMGTTGSIVRLSGVAPFDVLMGYAPGVNIEYNGEIFDTSIFEDRRVARITLGKAGDTAVRR